MKVQKQAAKRLMVDEDGHVLIFGAVCMTILLAFVALAVDVGMMFQAKRRAQTAADAGAIAGAQAVRYGLDTTATAQADAALNGFQDGSGGVTVTVNRPPATGPHKGNSSYVEVIVSAPEPTYFMRVMGFKSMSVSARAVAFSVAGDGCGYALSSTAKTGLEVAGTSTAVHSPGCSYYVNATGPKSVFAPGNGTLEASAISTAGDFPPDVLKSDTVTPPAAHAAPVSDPLANLAPPADNPTGCLADPKPAGTVIIGPASDGNICFSKMTITGGAANVTFDPGNYIINGSFTSNNETVTLGSGIYVINGNMSISGGSFSGSDVTIYIGPNGSLSISGTTLNLSAPTTGTYHGVLFYQDRSNSRAVNITGGANSTIEGILYFPSADLTFTGGSNSSLYNSFIAATITFAGGAAVNNYAEIDPGTPIWTLQMAE